ncbi:MAG: cytochrome C [Candidatus Kapabacteria bacterium]|nr:cytochrome C [Candidatus Kapabacteria bacterium]
MKKFFKIVLWIFGILLVVVLGLFAYIELSWNKTYDAPYPNIIASTDSTLIERGRYLIHGPGHCGGCHIPNNQVRDWDEGKELPLIGGWNISFPGLGTFRAPNLTPDKETGIGDVTDGQLARAVRYMVSHDNRGLMGFMRFQNMSDYDVTAIISYLRAQQPIKNKIEKSDYELMGKALLAFGLIKPEGPTGTPPNSVKIEPTAEYGKYVANSVANCYGCHTEFDPAAGKYIGKPYAGGSTFPPDEFSEGYAFKSPNLTPDKKTGVIANWTEDQFISRFKSGRIQRGSPMPWGAFSRMTEVDLKALYRYFMSLEPVNNKIQKTVFAPGEDFSKK